MKATIQAPIKHFVPVHCPLTKYGGMKSINLCEEGGHCSFVAGWRRWNKSTGRHKALNYHLIPLCDSMTSAIERTLHITAVVLLLLLAFVAFYSQEFTGAWWLFCAAWFVALNPTRVLACIAWIQGLEVRAGGWAEEDAKEELEDDEGAEGARSRQVGSS